jgi:hypothetical protein
MVPSVTASRRNVLILPRCACLCRRYLKESYRYECVTLNKSWQYLCAISRYIFQIYWIIVRWIFD